MPDFLVGHLAANIRNKPTLISTTMSKRLINPLNAELNLFYHLLALLGAHPILHISRIKVSYLSNQFSRQENLLRDVMISGWIKKNNFH
jgi:hypothetical protein